MEKLMKIRCFISYVVACGTIMFLGSFILNCKYEINFRLLFWDIRSAFIDNIYSEKYKIVYICLAIILLYIGYLMFSPCKLHWKIVIRGKLFEYVAGTVIKYVMVWIDVIGLILILIIMIHEKPMYNLDVKTKTIGHSFGLVDGLTYTGSYEAFQENYSLGQRVFEVDLLPTSDQKLVLRHKWNDNIQLGFSKSNIPTEKEFLETKIYGYLTPLSFTNLCELLQEYPDVYIVTDTKYIDAERMVPEFQIMSNTLNNGFQDVKDQIIVQIYTKEMLDIITGGGYKKIIFTFYNIWKGDISELIDLCRFCVYNGINTITIDEKYYTDDVQEVVDRYGLIVYLHTINDVDAAKDYLRKGVHGVYTDTIMPKDLED